MLQYSLKDVTGLSIEKILGSGGVTDNLSRGNWRITLSKSNPEAYYVSTLKEALETLLAGCESVDSEQGEKAVLKVDQTGYAEVISGFPPISAEELAKDCIMFSRIVEEENLWLVCVAQWSERMKIVDKRISSGKLKVDRYVTSWRTGLQKILEALQSDL
ncbi:MAG: hypothetical protein ACE5JP_16495 [Candidatus Bipolaricaulia bacterium]